LYFYFAGAKDTKDNNDPLRPLNDILQFIVFLVQSNLAHSSISCYLAGISFFCKINDFEDITQKIIVKKVLEGIKRSKGHMQDQRLPITLDLLKKVFGILPIVCASNYETVLFGATFSLAFFGLLRISEFAVSNSQTRHILSHDDVTLFENFVKLQIRSSKTDQLNRVWSFQSQDKWTNLYVLIHFFAVF